MTRRFRRSTPKRTGVIVIAAVLAMVGGVIVGIITTNSKSPVGLSAGECESAAPSQSAAAQAQKQTTTRSRTRHVGWTRTRHGWRHRPPAGEPSAAPSDPADPSAAPSEPADPSAAPSEPAEPSAEPSAAPSDSAEPSAAPSESAPPCPSESPGDGGSAQPSASASASAGAQPIGPLESDYVNIRSVRPNVQTPRAAANASRGTFTSNCGVSDHQNTANQVITPGVSDGAHHLHDLVGNKSADGLSTDDSLAASGTSCGNGDQSTYFWPVERIRGAGDDPTAAATQDQNNIGTPARPTRATIQWRGNPTSKVVAAPRFLKMVVGDAKTITNGLGNAKPTFTCTGFTNRITNKYPLCPSGSQVLSIHDFPSCWDGQNTDSANHRTHLVFPDAGSGACPQGTKAVPQLRITLQYNLPARALAFAVDGFATERHDPASDHAGAINVMTDDLMARAVQCINGGRRC